MGVLPMLNNPVKRFLTISNINVPPMYTNSIEKTSRIPYSELDFMHGLTCSNNWTVRLWIQS